MLLLLAEFFQVLCRHSHPRTSSNQVKGNQVKMRFLGWLSLSMTGVLIKTGPLETDMHSGKLI